MVSSIRSWYVFCIPRSPVFSIVIVRLTELGRVPAKPHLWPQAIRGILSREPLLIGLGCCLAYSVFVTGPPMSLSRDRSFSRCDWSHGPWADPLILWLVLRPCLGTRAWLVSRSDWSYGLYTLCCDRSYIFFSRLGPWNDCSEATGLHSDWSSQRLSADAWTSSGLAISSQLQTWLQLSYSRGRCSASFFLPVSRLLVLVEAKTLGPSGWTRRHWVVAKLALA